MSYYLYRMGLASKDELERRFKKRNAARKPLEQDRPLSERLGKNALKFKKSNPKAQLRISRLPLTLPTRLKQARVGAGVLLGHPSVSQERAQIKQ